MFSKLKIKWRLSILYTLVIVLLLLFISVSIYYFSYYVFMRLERNVSLARINRFLREGIQNKALMPGVRHFGELYVLNIDAGVVIQDPYGIGKIELTKESEVKKCDDEYIFFFKRRNYVVGYPVTSAMKVLEALKEILTLFFIFSSVLVFGISYFLAKKAIEPIKKINEEINEINVGNLDKRLKTVKNGDEINELCKHLNEMLGRLENGFETQNQFVNDVSHELRTPLTNFIGYVQLLKRWGYKDENILKESIEKLEKTSFEMKDLIENLLKLSKDVNVTDVNDINLNTKIKSMIKKYEVKYKDFNFSVIEKANLTIKTSDKYFDMLVNILVENAVKYSKNVQKVDFIIRDDSLSIKDYGIGISDTTKIFDRFYREDQSRNKKIPGFGIGLSLAKKIAKALDIKIEVISEKENGSEFKLNFKKDRS